MQEGTLFRLRKCHQDKLIDFEKKEKKNSKIKKQKIKGRKGIIRRKEKTTRLITVKYR